MDDSFHFSKGKHGGEYLPPRQIKEVLGISDSTLRRWAKKEAIEFIITPSGHRLYKVPSSQSRNQKQDSQKVCYARVSTHKQTPDLLNQVKFLKEKFPEHTIIKDIGSSLNWNRKGLTSILDGCFKGTITEVVVAHKDRLSRFAFELLHNIFERTGVKLVVLDQNTKSESEEFVDDIITIITTFSSKYYGKRKGSYKNSEDTSLSKH